MTASTCSGRYASPVAAQRSTMKATASSGRNSSGTSDSLGVPLLDMPRWRKYSIWNPRMRSTSFSVSVAAARSSRCCTTQPSASSGSNTASGGSSLSRAASRNTSAAAIASTNPMTTNTTTQVMTDHQPTRVSHPAECHTSAGSSNPDALGEQLAVVGGVAEEDLGALGAL